MPSIKQLEDQARALAADQKKLITEDTRDWSEKQEEHDKRAADLKSVIDQRNALKAVDRDPFDGADPASSEEKSTDVPIEQRSFGRQVTDSPDYKAMVAGQAKAGTVDVKVAATIDEGIIPAYSGGAGLAGQLNAPQFLPGVTPLKFQPLTIADLIPSGSTSASSISYVIESAFQDLTATVSEKGAKPQLDLTLARRQDNVTKIANVAKVTTEMFEDAPAFQSYLTNRMIFGVQRVEENQLLNGSGSTPNLQGILNRSGLATTVTTAAGLTAVKAMEGIYNQITALRAVSFVEPDAMVIHPTDWQTIRLGKDGQQQYYGGGPFTGAYGNAAPSNLSNLWGLKAVITTAIAQGTVLVGGFAESAQVFRRHGITVQMTDSNVDDFVNNLITLRAEERLALAVYRPAGFGKVVLTA
jgi:HK97 family phage major capsid protein